MKLQKELDGMVLIETLISPLQPNTGVIIAGRIIKKRLPSQLCVFT